MLLQQQTWRFFNANNEIGHLTFFTFNRNVVNLQYYIFCTLKLDPLAPCPYKKNEDRIIFKTHIVALSNVLALKPTLQYCRPIAALHLAVQKMMTVLENTHIVQK